MKDSGNLKRTDGKSDVSILSNHASCGPAACGNDDVKCFLDTDTEMDGVLEIHIWMGIEGGESHEREEETARPELIFSWKDESRGWHKRVKQFRRFRPSLNMKDLHDGVQSLESKIARIISAIHAVGSMPKDIACFGIGSVISVGWFSSILIDCVSR